jgi:hypothetical protein
MKMKCMGGPNPNHILKHVSSVNPTQNPTSIDIMAVSKVPIDYGIDLFTAIECD